MTNGLTRTSLAVSAGLVLLATAGLGMIVLADGLQAGINDWVRLWIAALIVSVVLLIVVVRPQLRRGLAEWKTFRAAREGLTMTPHL